MKVKDSEEFRAFMKTLKDDGRDGRKDGGREGGRGEGSKEEKDEKEDDKDLSPRLGGERDRSLSLPIGGGGASGGSGGGKLLVVTHISANGTVTTTSVTSSSHARQANKAAYAARDAMRKQPLDVFFSSSTPAPLLVAIEVPFFVMRDFLSLLMKSGGSREVYDYFTKNQTHRKALRALVLLVVSSNTLSTATSPSSSSTTSSNSSWFCIIFSTIDERIDLLQADIGTMKGAFALLS